MSLRCETFSAQDLDAWRSCGEHADPESSARLDELAPQAPGVAQRRILAEKASKFYKIRLIENTGIRADPWPNGLGRGPDASRAMGRPCLGRHSGITVISAWRINGTQCSPVISLSTH